MHRAREISFETYAAVGAAAMARGRAANRHGPGGGSGGSAGGACDTGHKAKALCPVSL
eukprot:COSAG06_NODE_1783_length_8405_cov_109.734595_6_plen_58_part_00